MQSRIFAPKKGRGFSYGESNIYTVKDGIYKEFAINISQATRRRKKERLIYLEQYDQLKQYYPQIEYFVEFIKKWYIQGYVMEEINISRLDLSTNFETNIERLHKIRDILALFRCVGLYYYDLHQGNVCINEHGEPVFLDIDSILYADETKPDILPIGLEEYRRHGGNLDEEFQRIKFNVLTEDILLYNNGRDFEYDEVGKEMLDSSDVKFQPNGPFSQEYLLDHILKKTR